jgi:putative transposase
VKMVEVLMVSRSGYYQWRKHLGRVEPEESAFEDLILSIYNEHYGRFGYRRILAEIRRRGLSINGKHVLRLMKKLGLRAICSRRYKVTTKSDHNEPVSKNILKQDFTVEPQKQVWLSDITFLKHLNDGFIWH